MAGTKEGITGRKLRSGFPQKPDFQPKPRLTNFYFVPAIQRDFVRQRGTCRLLKLG